MIFHPKHVLPLDGAFVLRDKVNATANTCFSADIFSEFWHNFTFRCSELHLTETADMIFSVGDVKAPELCGNAYAIRIEQTGFCVTATDKESLIHGFMALLDRIHAIDTASGIAAVMDCCEIKDSPVLQNRMVHFCIFPETELWELQRFLRLCGALKYSHVILEFWGTLQYDAMKELAWSHAFTKGEVRPIIEEAKALGLEMIPMFNHWGHASAGRVMHGKHVVLDQNPMLQTYFSDDGWCWNIRSEKVKTLLRRIRTELIELCGEGSYFHIGCDEAYNFDLATEEGMNAICDFLNEIASDLSLENRKTIVWGDMFLFRHTHYNPKNRYTCNAPLERCEAYMLSRLDKQIVIADWQYDATEFPVETASVFAKAGFECLICPWDRGVPQIYACLETAEKFGLSGCIHTTWHTLTKGMPYVTMAAVGAYEGNQPFLMRAYRTETASLLRKVFPANGDYERSGWAKRQIGILT